jgi:hypothetical protein
MLWNRDTIITGPAADFGEQANAFVRSAVEQFVTKVKRVNQR